MKKFFSVVIFLVFALTMQANSCSKNGGFSCGSSCGSAGANYKLIDSLWTLDLNEDQEGKLDTIIADHKKQMIDLEDEMIEAKRVSGFDKDKFDRKSFIQSKQDPFVKLLNAQANLFEKIHAVLTPNQREQFVANLSSCSTNNKRSKK